MGAEEVLNEIKQAIKQHLPSNVSIVNIDFEGPEIVVYTDNPSIFAEDGELIRELAKVIRRRIVVRPDPSVLADPEDAERRIREIAPEDANITSISFDPETGEVIIEAKKPGLVIGKYGKTLKEITKTIGWRPKVTRAPPIPSKIVNSTRHILTREREERKKNLQRIGRRIYRTPSGRGDWIRVTSLGGFREVGRTAVLVQTPSSKVLIDCGINVASEENAYPYLNVSEFRIEELEAVIVTHSHLDHCGLVPYLFKYGYDGPVYCTSPTRDLMSLLQLDYIEVTHREGKETPYTSKDIKEMIKHTIPLEYGEVTDIAPGIRLTLHNAGHILGSAIVHLHIGDGLYNFAYTGDVKFEPTRLFEPAVFRFPRLETLIIESTYGGLEDIQPSRQDAERELIKTIRETIARGGKVLIPVFAVGRAQELMILLEESIRLGIFEKVPVYMDGMIWEAAAIHTAYPEYLCKDLRDQIFHKGFNPFVSDMFIQVGSSEERTKIIEGEPSVIVATSGMMTGGPVLEYFKKLAEDPKNILLFVGYQAEGSLGRRIQKGWKEIPMSGANGKTEVIKNNMEVKTIRGFSGHSDRNQLIEYIRRLSPKPERLIICHGENQKCVEFASAIHKLFKLETKAPLNLETIRIK
ncbi:MAG: beta-CASP ribonuclease aCPSF1 [Euryarchaeota archaeon]|nr:beta-CASP ribonuclease aCPSF1 [Euryarchaeota archaeon]